MKNKYIRAVLLVVLAVVFVGSLAMVVKQVAEQIRAQQINEAAKDQAMQGIVSPEPTPDADVSPTPTPDGPVQDPLEENARFLMQTNLDALRQTNEDVLGWIHIPDSDISFPLIEAEDNQEYLRRAWDGSYNIAGCIFLECTNSPDFSDFNTLVYGHHMENGTMFAPLRFYSEQEYMDAHPYVYIVTDDYVRRYQVFATYEAALTSDTYRLYFEDEARRQSALDFYVESSLVQGGIVPETDDRILTLTTCTSDAKAEARLVVQAVLTGQFERT